MQKLINFDENRVQVTTGIVTCFLNQPISKRKIRMLVYHISSQKGKYNANY